MRSKYGADQYSDLSHEQQHKLLKNRKARVGEAGSARWFVIYFLQ